MTAIISPCGRYRYTLHRTLGHPIPNTVACIIMVNPSTADAVSNDATIRKLCGFGGRLGWADLIVVNKFAYRATDVNALKVAVDPIGPLTDAYIMSALIQSDVVVVAWGALGKLPPQLRDRWREIVRLAEAVNKPLYCFGTCADGHPLHPVMIPYGPIVPWVAP